MSWWDDDNDVLGDGPADRLSEAWRAILGARARTHLAKPTLVETLDAFASALRSVSLESPSHGIALQKGQEELRVFHGATEGSDLTKSFGEAIARIAEEYRQRFDRSPRPSELIKTLEFVIGYQTDIYLSDANVWPMRELRLLAASQ
jgi:hypothetical protein